MNSNEKNKGGDYSTILVLVFIVGAIFVLFNLMEEDKKQRQEAQTVVGNDEMNQESEEAPSIDKPTVEEEPQQPTKPQTTSKDELECTKTLKTEYGKFVYTDKYTFKYNKMVTGKVTVKATLNKSKMKYRDSLIQAFKEENSKFVDLKGISDSVKKTSNGFVYTFKIDASKLSAKELADIGYRTSNYSGVRMNAYNQGYKCE